MAENFDHVIRIGRHASGTGVIGVEPPPSPDVVTMIDEEVRSDLDLAQSGLLTGPRPHYELAFYAKRDSERFAVAERVAALLVRQGLTVGIDSHMTYMGYGATVLEAHDLDQNSGWRHPNASIEAYPAPSPAAEAEQEAAAAATPAP
jgi:hypothetical protein